MTDYHTLLQQITATVSKNHWSRYIIKTHPALHAWIVASASAYAPGDFNESVYILLNAPPNCCEHGNKPKFVSFNKGYTKFCEHGCACYVAAQRQRHADMSVDEKQHIADKYKQTMQERYGVDNPSKSETIKQSRVETNILRYGVDNPSKSDEVKSRIKRTTNQNWKVDSPMQSPELVDRYKQSMQENHGVDYPGHSTEIRAKIESTCMDRFGVNTPFKSNEIREKIKSTNIERYGVDNSSKSAAVQQQIRQTTQLNWGVDHATQHPDVMNKIKADNLQKFGVEHYFSSDDFKQKSTQTLLDRYGVPAGNSVHLTPDAFAKLNDASWLETAIVSRSIKSIADELSVDVTTVYNKLHTFELTANNGTGRSYAENEIASYIQHLGFDVVLNDRTVIAPKELDIVIPSAGIAIEYCGIYWHSNKWRTDDYHQVKYNAATAAGYQLLTIYDDEYSQSTDVVKSMLAHKLRTNTDKLHARKTKVTQVFDINRIRDFYNSYHIQGWDHGSSLTYALVYDTVDVAMMSFERIDSASVYLTRYATAVHCVGGASKLFAHFLRDNANISTVVSFADLRWSNGALYHTLNFTLDRLIPPDYQYIVNGQRKHKFGFRKARLREQYSDQFDMTGLTEREITEKLGFLRIYDCGKLRFIYRR